MPIRHQRQNEKVNDDSEDTPPEGALGPNLGSNAGHPMGRLLLRHLSARHAHISRLDAHSRFGGRPEERPCEQKGKERAIAQLSIARAARQGARAGIEVWLAAMINCWQAGINLLQLC
jgi:hypothetical protein